MPFRIVVLSLSAILVVPAVALAAGGQVLHLPYWSITPFVLLLLAIAIFPLVAGHFWHSNRNKAIVAAAFGIPTVLYLVYVQLATGQPAFEALAHEIEQYVDFIILLGSLYIVSGGIHFSGDLDAKPLTNTLLLAIGSVSANLVGTTGASVLLIRPFLRINKQRQHTAHLPVFFIFTVSNLGGLLTPLGDPPLFLGFLNNVPFAWTLRLWPQWLVSNGIVLAVFYVWESLVFRKEEKRAESTDKQVREPLRIQGLLNIPLLMGIIAAVLFQGLVLGAGGRFGGPALMLLMGFLSLALTPKSFRQANSFTWEPISEVAILFAGIFVTMVPALDILSAHGKELGLTQPWEYFWLTGILSAHLDNAPTYLTFATLAAGSDDFSLLVINDPRLNLNGPLVLQAISCGAVMMGALTYIGNGPNFMVKAIAEGAGYKMPSFFGFLGYSYAVLLPTFIVITFLFFYR
jgi:Na+/H+ antiporter NhaD/arsenite permease-like protein